MPNAVWNAPSVLPFYADTMPRLLAHLFSTFGHPMLVPTYALLLLLFANPYTFGVNSPGDKKALLLLLYVFTTTALIPGIGIAVMKPLGFVGNLESPDRQERIGPYIITGVFYLWLYQNLKSGGQAPPLYRREQDREHRQRDPEVVLPGDW